jgi:catechol 2,3-dioxygenase-like lactoylglutathione lyase family enzyme
MSVDYVMHFGVCVRDLPRSIRFYTEGLGFVEKGKLHIEDAPTAQMMGIPDLVLDAVYLDRDGVRIELLAYPKNGTVGPATARPMNQPGLTHFAVRVDDRDAMIGKLTALGGQLIPTSRIENPDFKARICYVTDPDGTRIELVEVPTDPTR